MRPAASATRAAALVAACLAACSRHRSPEGVLADYAAHLRAGRIEAAYALTTPRYRAAHSRERFALLTARQPRMRAAAPATRPELVVELLAEGGAPVILTGPDVAHLRLANDPMDVYPRETPEAALGSLARAIDRGRHDRMTALLTPPLRARGNVPPAGTPMPEPLLNLAAELHRLLVPSSGTSTGLLESRDGGLRLLLGSGGTISLISTPEGWLVSELP